MVLSKYSYSTWMESQNISSLWLFRHSRWIMAQKKENLVIILSLNMSITLCLKALSTGSEWVKSLSLWDPVDCSPPGSSVHWILQARILEWVAISFSRGSSRPRDWTQVSRIAGRRFNLWATREPSPKALLREQSRLSHFLFLPCPN